MNQHIGMRPTKPLYRKTDNNRSPGFDSFLPTHLSSAITIQKQYKNKRSTGRDGHLCIIAHRLTCQSLVFAFKVSFWSLNHYPRFFRLFPPLLLFDICKHHLNTCTQILYIVCIKLCNLFLIPLRCGPLASFLHKESRVISLSPKIVLLMKKKFCQNLYARIYSLNRTFKSNSLYVTSIFICSD